MLIQNTRASQGGHEGAASMSASLSSVSPKKSESTQYLQKVIGLSPQVQRMRRFQQMANQGRPIQRGGAKWTPQGDREMIGKLFDSGGYASFYTKDADSHYVEAWKNIDDTWTYVGYIQIVVVGNAVVLHTRSEEGMDGGMLGAITVTAIKKVVEDFGGYATVNMMSAPGAASKKLIEMLSSTVGTPDIHKEAEKLKKTRKEHGNVAKPLNETPEEREKRLQTWHPSMMSEHHLHLESLARSPENGDMTIVGPAGPLVGTNDNVEAEDQVRSIRGGNNAGYVVEISMDKVRLIAKRL